MVAACTEYTEHPSKPALGQGPWDKGQKPVPSAKEQRQWNEGEVRVSNQKPWEDAPHGRLRKGCM